MVPLMIDQELLWGLDWDRGLYLALAKGLEITGPGSFEKAKEYLQETPDVKSRREGLLRKRERLLSAKQALQTTIGYWETVPAKGTIVEESPTPMYPMEIEADVCTSEDGSPTRAVYVMEDRPVESMSSDDEGFGLFD